MWPSSRHDPCGPSNCSAEGQVFHPRRRGSHHLLHRTLQQRGQGDQTNSPQRRVGIHLWVSITGWGWRGGGRSPSPTQDTTADRTGRPDKLPSEKGWRFTCGWGCRSPSPIQGTIAESTGRLEKQLWERGGDSPVGEYHWVVVVGRGHHP